MLMKHSLSLEALPHVFSFSQPFHRSKIFTAGAQRSEPVYLRSSSLNASWSEARRSFSLQSLQISSAPFYRYIVSAASIFSVIVWVTIQNFSFQLQFSKFMTLYVTRNGSLSWNFQVRGRRNQPLSLITSQFPLSF